MKRKMVLVGSLFAFLIAFSISAKFNRPLPLNSENPLVQEEGKGGRPTEWIESTVQCDADKEDAIAAAKGYVVMVCIVRHGGTIVLWSTPSCQYNLETHEWCCTIGGNCYWP